MVNTNIQRGLLLPQPLVYVKFGVQSCLKINTCVCLSDFLCGFQQGKTEFGKIEAKSTTLPKNKMK